METADADCVFCTGALLNSRATAPLPTTSPPHVRALHRHVRAFPEQASALDMRGFVKDMGGLVMDMRGLVKDMRGLVMDMGGLVMDMGGLVMDMRGLVMDMRGLVEDMRGLVKDMRGLVRAAYVPALDLGGSALKHAPSDCRPHSGSKRASRVLLKVAGSKLRYYQPTL